MSNPEQTGRSATKVALGWREWVGLPELGLPLLKAKVDTGARTSTLHAFYVESYRYRGEPFVKVIEAPPHTKHTWGSNLCFIHSTIDHRTGKIIVISSIDNLVKGAAGQAIQNMNLMLGFPEITGLQALAIYP